MRSVVLPAVLFTSTSLMAVDALAVPAPGPDAFGYTASAIASNFRGIGPTGTQFNLGDDGITDPIDIGFAFNFYGNVFSQVTVSSNGFMSFDLGVSQGCCSGRSIPFNDFVNNIIAGVWEDLDSNANATGTMYHETRGTAGSREFIVEFLEVEHFPTGNPVTFEMILHEGTNDIELQYLALSGDSGIHTIGIENADGSDGIELFMGSGSDIAQFSNTAVCFDHPGSRDSLCTGAKVPEPGTLALIAIGFAGLGFRRWAR